MKGILQNYKMEEEKREDIEINTSKLTSWFTNKNNLMFLGVLIFAIAIRLYYFKMTYNQPLWWDEAEYMNMAKAWAFSRPYEFLAVRPVLFSFFASLFFRITSSEFPTRFLMLILSIFSVVGVYYLGKEVYDQRTGLLASFFMSIFYLNLFFSYRLLVDLPSLTFFTFGAYFFYRYFKNNEVKMLYYGAIVIGIGTLFRINTAVYLFVAAIFTLLTNAKLLKKKEVWISALIFFLILSPYLIWGYLQFHGFVITQAGKYNAPVPGTVISTALSNTTIYLSSFPTYMTWTLLLFTLLGLFLMYNLVLAPDLLSKGHNKLKGDFYILLLLLIPFLAAVFLIAHTEDRYILNVFPAIFIIGSLGIFKGYDLIKKKSKILAIILLCVLLIFITYSQYQSADGLIKQKLTSYGDFKDAGSWLKQNSLQTDRAVVSGSPMVTFYSDRDSFGFPNTEEEFNNLLKTDKNIKYFILAAIQPSPDWTYAYPQRHNLTVAKSYSTLNSNQASLIIYKL